MKTTIIFALFLVSSLHAQSYFIQMDGEKIKADFFLIENALVNDFCKEKINKCQALLIFKGSPKFPQKLELGILSSEAQAYCKHLGGVPLRLINEQNEQNPFCSFGDMTIISSWDLFNSHSARAKNK